MFSGAVEPIRGDVIDEEEQQRECTRFADSTKINQLLSVLMTTDSLMPPPTNSDSSYFGEFGLTRSPMKPNESEHLSKKRKVVHAGTGGASSGQHAGIASRTDKWTTDQHHPEVGNDRAVFSCGEHNSQNGDHDPHERDSAHSLHLDDEDHEWFRNLFRSSVTPREYAGGSFTEPPTTTQVNGGFEDHFSNAFHFSPSSPMFHSSTRLTPSRRAPSFFSPDLDISSSPRRDDMQSGHDLNREFLFGDGEIPSYEPRVKELILPSKRLRKKKKRAAQEGSIISFQNEISITDMNIFDKGRSHQENDIRDIELRDQVSFHRDNPLGTEESSEPIAMAQLPSIPASLLMAPVHEDVHIKLDPILPMHDAAISISAPLPAIPKEFLKAPATTFFVSTELSPNASEITVAKTTNSEAIPSVDAVELNDLSVKPGANAPPEAVQDMQALIAKPKRKTINILVIEIITLLDIDILLNYFPGAPLNYSRLKSKGENAYNLSHNIAKSMPTMTSQPHIDAALQLDEVRQRLSSKDVRDLIMGNLSSTNIAKLLGESHHRRVWEVTTVLATLGLMEQSPQRNFMRRCKDDSKMITHLGFLQNEAIFQFPRNAVANGLVPADYFKSQGTLLFQLQSSLAPAAHSSTFKNTATNAGEYDHAFYYKGVLKIFLSGTRCTVPDIKRIFIGQGCHLNQSGERRLYDAISVLLGVGIIRKHEDPLVYVASVAKRLYTWNFHDLKDIRQQWLQAET